MVIVTSTLCTAVFPDLDLRLEAGVPTSIQDSQVERMSSVPGIEITTPAPAAAPDPAPIPPPEES